MEGLINIGSTNPDNHKSYQDGDVVMVKSNVEIEYCHAEMICHAHEAGFNSAGFRNTGSLLYKYLENTSKYRFTRLNSNDVERYNLLTDEVDIVNTTPNAKGEYIYVDRYIARRLRQSDHKIFGSEQGKEIWYGGYAIRDRASSDTLWQNIESHSDKLKQDHKNFPLSPIEQSRFLPINCCGYKNNTPTEVSCGTCGDRCYPIFSNNDEDQVLITRSKWCVPYWDLSSELEVDMDDVRDKNKTVDARRDVSLDYMCHMDDIYVDKVAAGIITL